MKKLILIFTILIAAAALIYLFSGEKSTTSTASKKIERVHDHDHATHTHEHHKDAKHYIPPAKEIKPKKVPRLFVGKKTKNQAKLKFVNSVSKEWKSKATHDLLRHFGDDMSLEIRHENSLITQKGNNARYVEQVHITFLKNGKHHSTYRALVDSETGKLIKTWDRIRHENKRQKGIRLFPSGEL